MSRSPLGSLGNLSWFPVGVRCLAFGGVVVIKGDYLRGSSVGASAVRVSFGHLRDNGAASTHHKEEINVVQAKTFQTLVQTKLDTGVVCRPHLAHDEDVLALDTGGKCLGQTGADFILVAVAVGAVNKLVARLDGVSYGFLDTSGLGLPCAYEVLVGLV